MSAMPHPPCAQVGARTLAAIQRQLVRVPLSLDEALEGRLPLLPPLGREATGYQVTSLPQDRRDAMAYAGGGMIAFVRQHYTRHYADLTIGHERWLDRLCAETRAALRQQASKAASVSGGGLDIRRFRTPAEMTGFHDVARRISRRSYRERILPDDPAFLREMHRMAAADAVRGWLLYIAGEPAAYLYCPVEAGVARYDQVGHDPAFSDLAPGGILQMEAMRDLYREGGLKRFDFSEGDGQIERQFATGGVPCLDMLLLRPSLANRLTTAALGTVGRATAWGKRATATLGLEKIARRTRAA